MQVKRRTSGAMLSRPIGKLFPPRMKPQSMFGRPSCFRGLASRTVLEVCDGPRKHGTRPLGSCFMRNYTQMQVYRPIALAVACLGLAILLMDGFLIDSEP